MSRKKDTFWPLYLVSAMYPSARISTYGFQNQTIRGHLVAGQLDLCAYGRELLDAVREMWRSSRGAAGGGRELVFVAHGTSGIVVRDLRLVLQASICILSVICLHLIDAAASPRVS